MDFVSVKTVCLSDCLPYQGVISIFKNYIMSSSIFIHHFTTIFNEHSPYLFDCAMSVFYTITVFDNRKGILLKKISFNFILLLSVNWPVNLVLESLRPEIFLLSNFLITKWIFDPLRCDQANKISVCSISRLYGSLHTYDTVDSWSEFFSFFNAHYMSG